MGCPCVLQLVLLAKLLKFCLFFAVEAWTAVAVSSCGSALRAAFFFKTTFKSAEAWAALVCCMLGLRAELLECALLLIAGAWATSTAPFCGSALRADFFF